MMGSCQGISRGSWTLLMTGCSGQMPTGTTKVLRGICRAEGRRLVQVLEVPSSVVSNREKGAASWVLGRPLAAQLEDDLDRGGGWLLLVGARRLRRLRSGDGGTASGGLGGEVE